MLITTKYAAAKAPMTRQEADKLADWILVWNGDLYENWSTNGCFHFEDKAHFTRSVRPDIKGRFFGGPSNGE